MHTRYTGVVTVVITFCCALFAFAAPRTASPQLYQDPEKRYTIEFPAGWPYSIVVGYGDALVVFASKDSAAAVVVEHTRLRQWLDPDEITEVFAEIEASGLKEHQPKTMDVTARLAEENGRKVVLIDYRRPLAMDTRFHERVRTYSFPVGNDLYRVTCSALENRFAEFESTFRDIARSLKPAGVKTRVTNSK